MHASPGSKHVSKAFSHTEAGTHARLTWDVLAPPVQELVQRGLIASFIAGWIADRAFEAGIDDQITLLGGSSYYLPDVCRCVSARVFADGCGSFG